MCQTCGDPNCNLTPWESAFIRVYTTITKSFNELQKNVAPPDVKEEDLSTTQMQADVAIMFLDKILTLMEVEGENAKKLSDNEQAQNNNTDSSNSLH
jgi:hypothetical protein